MPCTQLRFGSGGTAILCTSGKALGPQEVKEIEEETGGPGAEGQGSRGAGEHGGPSAVYRKMVVEMRKLALRTPWRPGDRIKPYRRRLPGGLTAEFYLNAATDEFTLALMREDVDPTNDECEAAREAFGGPKLFSRQVPIYIKEGLRITKFMWARQHDQKR